VPISTSLCQGNTATCVDAEAVPSRLQRCARVDWLRIRTLDLRL